MPPHLPSMTKRHYENFPKIAKLLRNVKYQGNFGAKSCRTNAITFILHLPQGHALQRRLEKETKNTIRDGGSTALYTALLTLFSTFTLLTLLIWFSLLTWFTLLTWLFTVDSDTDYAIETSLHCINISMHACIYC